MDDKGGGFQFFDGLLVEKGHFEKGEEGEKGAGGRFTKDDIKGRSRKVGGCQDSEYSVKVRREVEGKHGVKEFWCL